MPSSKDYLDFVLEQLSEIEGIAWKQMMGEYLLYVQGKLIGGIYDNRFLVKPTKGASALLPDAPHELPYEGAKPMLLVEDMENRELLSALCRVLYDELPAAKKNSKKGRNHDAEQCTPRNHGTDHHPGAGPGFH